MKLVKLIEKVLCLRRAPRGARGLKLGAEHDPWNPKLSRPARGAWIETKVRIRIARKVRVAPRAGRVD